MSHKERVIQLGPLAGSPGSQERLESLYEVIPVWQAADPIAEIARAGQDARVLVTTATRGCPAEVIHALPRLEAICSWGVGYETIAVDAAHQRNIQVSNTPDVLTDCVADLAWGLMIASSRRIAAADRYVRDGKWGGNAGSFPLGQRVSGKKLGILGLGRIGAAIARRGIGFDMEVRYHNRKPRTDVTYGYSSSLLELANWADYLVVAAVGGAETRGLVSYEIMRALGPQGTLVNIARGPVVDETALIRALEDGSLGAAGLDVFEKEPAVPDALKQSDKVVLLPHIGSATRETRAAMADLLFDNLQRYFADGKVLTPV